MQRASWMPLYSATKALSSSGSDASPHLCQCAVLVGHICVEDPRLFIRQVTDLMQCGMLQGRQADEASQGTGLGDVIKRAMRRLMGEHGCSRCMFPLPIQRGCYTTGHAG